MSTSIEQGRPGWLARNWPAVLLLVVVAAVLIGWGVSVRSLRDEAWDIRAQAEQARTEAEQVRAAAESERQGAVRAVTRADPARKQAHDRRAEDLMRTVTTWSNGAEYDQARTSVKDRFGLAEDSPLLSTLLPEQSCNTTGEGERICEVDAANTSSRFADLDSKLVSLDGDRYSYFAMVEITTESNSTGVNGTTTIPMTYTVSGDNKISDVEAHPAMEPVSSSE